MMSIEQIKKLNPQEHTDLRKLSTIDYKEAKDAFDSLKKVFAEYYDSGCKLLKDNNILNIGVVGQVKAGKSSFLNSLIFNGENVLPQASTPMTAGLTILRYGEEDCFEVEYYNQDEWNVFVQDAKAYDERMIAIRQSKPELASFSNQEIEKMYKDQFGDVICSAKELVERCIGGAVNKVQAKAMVDQVPFIGIETLQSTLNEYVGADGKYTSVVKSLTIYLKDERLKGIQIVDTPGVNDPIVSRENRTRQYLQSSHGVFFLSYSGRFFDSTDTQFLVERIGNQGVGSVVVLASKYDSVLQDVGLKYEDDLPAADDDCQKKLKGQMKRNISESTYKGEMPIFDVNSGIGYSIAHKEKSRWSGVEQNVVQQMRTFYPSYFSTDEQIKELFNQLSNIDGIKEKYLEGEFKKNKDEIIQKKTNEFVKLLSQNINKEVDKHLQDLNTKEGILKKNNLDSLKKQKESMANMLEGMEKEIVSIVNAAKKTIEGGKKKILNNVSFHVSVPVENKTTVLSEKKFFLFNSKEEVVYQEVNKSGLEILLKEELQKCTKGVLSAWEKIIKEDVNDIIISGVNEFATDYQLKHLDSKIDTSYFNKIVRDVASSFNDIGELGFSGLISEMEGQITSITNTQNVSSHSYYTETKNLFISASEEQVRLIRSRVNDLKPALLEKIQREMNKGFDALNDELSQMQENFLKDLKDDIDESYARLEVEITKIDESMEKIKQTKQALEALKQ